VSEYYSEQAFLDAWLRGVQMAGPRWFGDGGVPTIPTPTKYDLAPRYDDIMANLGVLSSGEAAFLVAMYSFYNSYAAAGMWKLASAAPMAGLASCLDEPRRRIIADLLVSYEGW
jgi:hypothetical protein